VGGAPETAENVATDFKIERETQNRVALASQQKAAAAAAQQAGHLAAAITAVSIAQKKGDALIVSQCEHPRATSLEALAKLNLETAVDRLHPLARPHEHRLLWPRPHSRFG